MAVLFGEQILAHRKRVCYDAAIMGFQSFISLMMACVGLLTLARREFGIFGRNITGDMAWRIGIFMLGAGLIGLAPISPGIWATITYGTILAVTIVWIISGRKSAE